MKPTSDKKQLSLEAFADMVLSGDSWKEQMPDIMAQLPSVDDALKEMAFMPEEKRTALREKVALMQGEVGKYITALGAEMRERRSNIHQARQGTQASTAYSRTETLVTPDKKDAANE